MSKVSIILPTHNGAHFIEAAIESVLAQSFSDWELFIIDDGSTDSTEDIIQRYTSVNQKIILIKNKKNIGIQKTLNKGIAVATGKYIARIDDDDRWIEANKLSAQIEYLENHPEYVLIGTDAVVTDSIGKKLSVNIMPKDDSEIRNIILSKNCFLHATILFRKDIVQKVGGYSESAESLHAEDYELWLRMGLEGKMNNLAIQSTQLIAHDASLSSRNRVGQARHIISIVKKYKNKYPNFYYGYYISTLRYMFFSITATVPIPKGLLYFFQRIYRSA